MDYLKKATRVSLTSQIVKQMEWCINRGIWPVNSKIPSELELVDRLGVSRNTVREATMALVHAGLLRTQQGDGTYVTSSSRMDAAIALKFKESTLRDVLEVRLALEINIITLACKRSSREDFQELEVLFQKRQDLSTSVTEFIENDAAFHIQLAKQSHNELFHMLYRSCMSYFEEEINTYLMSTLSSSSRQNEEHYALYCAVLDGNEEAAIQMIKKIIEGEREELTQVGLLP